MMNADNPQPEFALKIPEGDNRERSVCTRCGFIDYQNPKIVVGSVVVHGSKFLLCKRAIHPRKGYWTLPAGFLELQETVEQGAIREAQEEANAQIQIQQLLAYYNVPHISQVQIMFSATLQNPESVEAGEETEEVGLFSWEDIPWADLAFPSVYWALKQYREIQDSGTATVFTNPPSGL